MRSWIVACVVASVVGAMSLGGCSSEPTAQSSDGAVTSAVDPTDLPIEGISANELGTFDKGDALFDLPLREADGLGPLYTRTSCGDCHDGGARGPGLVQKMSVVNADGHTAAEDQSRLAFGHTVHPLVAGGGKTPIIAPLDDPAIKVSIRVGPPVLGRGFLEAILDSEILRVEAEQSSRTDGIKGRVNKITHRSEFNPASKVHATKKGDQVIGRFGLKARIGFLDDFVADAMQGDMGITSPLRPNEIPNPDGLLDDSKLGVDVTLESVELRADYIRMLAIPPRRRLTARGAELFASTKCAVCHTPALATRADYPIRPLAGTQAPVFTDLLLHDMGDALADGLPVGEDGDATSREWRTAPLIGLRFMNNYLHDSRAHSVLEAILMHAGSGSQANGSIDSFNLLSTDDRATLLAYVEAL